MTYKRIEYNKWIKEILNASGSTIYNDGVEFWSKYTTIKLFMLTLYKLEVIE